MKEKCLKSRFVSRTILVIFAVLALFVFAGTVLGNESDDGSGDHQENDDDCDEIEDQSHVDNAQNHVDDDDDDNEDEDEDDECRTPPAPTPELSTSILMSAGLIGLIGFSRLNKK